MPKAQTPSESNNSGNPAGLALPDFVLEASSLSKSLIEDDRAPSEHETSLLRSRIAETFQRALIQLAEFPKQQEAVTKNLEASRRLLATNKTYVSLEKFLKAEENLNRALVIIDRNFTTTRSIKRMIFTVIVSSIFYLSIIGILAYLAFTQVEFNVLGVPGLVLAWGCLGGVTVILFRHRSMMEKKWPFDLRWLWIAVRPLLGMVMGAFVFLGVVSGLLLFGTSSTQGVPQIQILSALAFVAGFSDRFWEILISSALGPYSKENISDHDSETS